MKKLGIALHNLGASQLNYSIISNVNKFMKSNYKTDIICFYENVVKQSMPLDFACMQAIELWGYDGPVVATNLNLALDICKIPSISKRYFYIWDLEWVYMDDKNYNKLLEVYSNPDLTLITRNKDYADLLKSVWNIKVDEIVEDFNIEKLMDILV